VTLIFSEIMFNPASSEPDWEWVEITNIGDTIVDLSDYVLDDKNGDAHGTANIASGSIAAGQSAVLYNADDVSAIEFTAAWGSGINLIAVTNWGDLQLNNDGDTVGLWDSFSSYSGDNETHTNAVISVTYPPTLDNNAGSIYLTDLADPDRFTLSIDAVIAPTRGVAYTSVRTGLNAGDNNGRDVGSPGSTLPPSLTIADVTRSEGNAGTQDLTFTVTRSNDTRGSATVDFTIADGSARAGQDYTATPGTLTFSAGDTSQTITVNAIGDTTAELDETFTVTLANASGDTVITTATATGTIKNDDAGVVIAKIHEIQGSGTVSALDGQTVTIEGVVTGDFQTGSGTNGDLNGFYVQEEDSDRDGNAATSDGIFINDGSSPGVDVSVGDRVRVTGTVDELSQLTAITSLTNVTVQSPGNALPAIVDLDLPAASIATNADGKYIADLEAFEGMRVRLPATLSVTELFQLDRYGEIQLAQGGGLTQFTQTNAPSVAGYDAHLQSIAKRTIILDDGQTRQNPDPIVYPDGNLDPSDSLRHGDTIANLTGIVHFGRASGANGDETYRMMPTVAPTFNRVNARSAAPSAVGGDLTVASFNVLNYFTTLNSRGADTASEFERQTDKLVTALARMDADVVGLVELENNYTAGANSAIAKLVDRLNATVGAGTYAYIDPGRNVGDDAIAVGVIYKPSAVSLAADTTIAVLTDANLPAGFSGSIFSGGNTNRSPLAVTLTENATNERFTLVVNHLKSKGGIGTGADADAGDGQGSYNATRLRGAQAIDAWLDGDPTGSGDRDLLMVGDFNAYTKEDPIAFLSGEYDNLIADRLGASAYSYVFDGQAGVLDYAFSSATLTPQVTGVTEWHINADEPDAFDYDETFNPSGLFDSTTPDRASDHDPVIVGLQLRSVLENPVAPPASSPEVVVEVAETDISPEPESETPPSETVENLGSAPDFSALIAQILTDLAPQTDRPTDRPASPASSITTETTPSDDIVTRDRDDTTADIIAALPGNDYVNTGGSDDLVFGNVGNDELFGDRGNDSLFGGQDDDILNGGADADWISGDRGADTLTGGDGADTFLFRTGDGSDLLTDFTPGQDKLIVVEILENLASGQNRPGVAIGENLIENFNVGENRLGTVRVLSFADLTIGSDGTRSMIRYNGELLASLSGVTSLTAADIVGL
jgi:predicted extracellular nuclease